MVRTDLVTMEDNTIYKQAIRCGNCGSLMKWEDENCESCGAQFDVDQQAKRYQKFRDGDLINTLNMMVPNGNAVVDGEGGIGYNVCNHHIPMGCKETDNDLTIRAIVKAMTVLQTEECVADVMIIHPFQMYEVVKTIEFVGIVEHVNRTNINHARMKKTSHFAGSVVGYWLSMAVIVNKSQPAGTVLILDSLAIQNPDTEKVRDALVSLTRGRTSL